MTATDYAHELKEKIEKREKKVSSLGKFYLIREDELNRVLSLLEYIPNNVTWGNNGEAKEDSN